MIIEGLEKAIENFPSGERTVLEFGVWKGGTYLRLVDYIMANSSDISLIGFDSWLGLPEETKGVWIPERHSTGMYAAPKDIVSQGLSERGLENNPKFALIDGFFEQTLTKELQSTIKNLIFVNIDVDIHKSTVELLDFIYPLLRAGVILYFDDWKDPVDDYDGKWGEHLAWEQFIEKHPEIKYKTLKINEYNQRLIEIE